MITKVFRKMPPPVTIRKCSLAPTISDALADVGAKLRDGRAIGPELGQALDLLAELPPGQISNADPLIANTAGLHHRAPTYRGFTIHEQLLRTPRLEYLFIFHRDGRLREHALLKMAGGLPSAFLFAAVVWRLNDWAAPVRKAAVQCARRSFPATDPQLVAQATLSLLASQLNWRRWGDERRLFDEAVERLDVAEHLSVLLANGATGPLASVLRSALRRPGLDSHLATLATMARQPSVRAVALEALIDGRASWPSGYGWKWIDKSMGKGKRILTFDHRPLTVTMARDALIAAGASDRSAVVRRAALDGVIRHLLSAPAGREIAERLLSDRSPPVRDRADFIVRRSDQAD